MILLLQILDSEADRALLGELFAQNYHRMRRVAFGILGTAEAAEDAVQDTFLRCIQHVNTLGALPFHARTAYLLTAVKHNALNRKQSSGAHETVSLDTMDLPDPSAAVEERAIRGLTAAALADAMKNLPDSMQDLLRYKYLLELNDGEIAKTLGVKKSTVRVYLMRARNALLNLCKERDDA